MIRARFRTLAKHIVSMDSTTKLEPINVTRATPTAVRTGPLLVLKMSTDQR